MKKAMRRGPILSPSGTVRAGDAIAPLFVPSAEGSIRRVTTVIRGSLGLVCLLLAAVVVETRAQDQRVFDLTGSPLIPQFGRRGGRG